jgi:predicted DCC family thiol-disulfide oxidoreductase YuxK
MEKSIICFDGVCNLCNDVVQFIIPRDPHGCFQFAALDSEAARRVLREAGVTSGDADSVILIEHGRAYVRSAAALRIARRLRFPWPLAYGLIAVPRPLRDWFYDVVARNRYRWFGKRDVCLVAAPEIRSRFLDSPQAGPLR